MVKNLLIINVLLHVSFELTGADAIKYAMCAFYPTGASGPFYPWQIVTHMFLHADIGHIAFNMIGLYFFGTYLERLWGAKKFLVFYMACGLVSYFLHEFANGFQIWMACGSFFPDASVLLEKVSPVDFKVNRAFWKVPALGASGAVLGLVMGFAVLFPEVRLQLLFPPIPIKAKTMALLYVGFSVFSIITGGMDNIAHFAHLGGLLCGYLMIKYWQNKGKGAH